MRTSAPTIASARLPVLFSVLVCAASHRRALVQTVVIFGQDPVSVDPDDVSDAFGQEQLRDGDASGTDAEHDDADVLHLLADDTERVQEGGEDDGRRPVLVVMEDGDVECLAQPGLDFEASRRRDVLEVDPTIDRGDALDDPHDLVDILGGQAHWPRVDARESLEK